MMPEPIEIHISISFDNHLPTRHLIAQQVNFHNQKGEPCG